MSPTSFPRVAVVCAATLIACDASPGRDPTAPSSTRPEADATTATPGPAATGDAHILIFNGTTPERFEFSAVVTGAGLVAGEFQLFTEQAGGISIQGPVTCLGISGNLARIGGVITESSLPAFVGRPVLWEVVDNGEGVNAPPDQTSDFAAVQSPDVVATFCATGSGSLPFPLQLMDVLRGNIQVFP